jgi:uncharacterized membrane protein YsdA (DUF1294 family)
MENFGLYIAILLGIVNLVSFVLVGVDKSRSVDREERVPEVYFFFLASCFASIGVLLGMFIFHHKTRKIYFPLGISLLLLQQMFLVLYITNVIT